MDKKLQVNPEKSKRVRAIRKGMTYSFLVLFAIVIIIPFYWMILTSLKSFQDLTVTPPILFLPFNKWNLDNFKNAMEAAPYITFMKNTVIVSTISTIGTIFTTIFAAFAFSRLNFKGRDALFFVLLSSMMIPGEMFVITNFITVSDLGWLGSNNVSQTYADALKALSFPFMTSIFYIFFLRQAFRQIPDELYYAAKVDGTSDFKYLWRIMVPIAKPTIITIIILNAMGTWNAYIWPNLVTDNENFRLVTNGLRTAYNELSGQVIFNEQMAAALIVTAPLLAVFFLLKKYIMRGVSRSGIKG